MDKPDTPAQPDLLEQYDLREESPASASSPPELSSQGLDAGEGAASPRTPPEPAAGEEPQGGDTPSAPQPRDRETGRFQKKHPRALVSRAKAFGLDDDEIADMDTAELRGHLQDLALDRVLQGREQAAMNREQPVQQPHPETPPEPAEDLGVGAAELDNFDPGLVKVLRQQAREIAELKRRLNLQDSARQAETTDELIDVQFAQLGADFEPLIGKGGRREVKGPELHRRRAILSMAHSLAGKGATLEQQLAQIPVAAQLLFEKSLERKPAADTPQQALAKDLLTQRQEQWNKGGLALPTQRTGVEPKGKGKARKSVASLLQEFGADERNGDTDSLDGFLG